MFRRLGDEKGQDLVEFALIASLLFLLIFGIIDLGIVVWNYNTIANAAREGARYGIIASHVDCGDPADEDRCVGEMKNRVYRLTTGLDQDPDRLQCTCTHISDPVSGMKMVQVVVTYDAQLITGPVFEAVGVPAITLRTAATMQRE